MADSALLPVGLRRLQYGQFAGCIRRRPIQPRSVRSPCIMASFYGEHGGRPPKDEAEFREFFATRQVRLKAVGLDVDRLLASSRSGESLVVVYGATGALVVDGKAFVAYEKNAVDGRRMAVNLLGEMESIEDAKFSAAVPR